LNFGIISLESSEGFYMKGPRNENTKVIYLFNMLIALIVSAKLVWGLDEVGRCDIILSTPSPKKDYPVHIEWTFQQGKLSVLADEPYGSRPPAEKRLR
jgi:hypothetical protein